MEVAPTGSVQEVVDTDTVEAEASLKQLLWSLVDMEAVLTEVTAAVVVMEDTVAVESLKQSL